jgi:hypothetical protein
MSQELNVSKEQIIEIFQYVVDVLGNIEIGTYGQFNSDLGTLNNLNTSNLGLTYSGSSEQEYYGEPYNYSYSATCNYIQNLLEIVITDITYPVTLTVGINYLSSQFTIDNIIATGTASASGSVRITPPETICLLGSNTSCSWSGWRNWSLSCSTSWYWYDCTDVSGTWAGLSLTADYTATAQTGTGNISTGFLLELQEPLGYVVIPVYSKNHFVVPVIYIYNFQIGALTYDFTAVSLTATIPGVANNVPLNAPSASTISSDVNSLVADYLIPIFNDVTKKYCIKIIFSSS